MPVSVSWYLENRVVYVKLIGNVTPDEISSTSTEFIALVEQSSAPLVHAIHDATELDSLPKSLKVVVDAIQNGYGHPRLGWSVAFGVGSDFLRFVGEMTGRIFRIRYHIVQSKTEALAWLENVDSTLPPLEE
jgi:hypothetical protein